MRLHKGTVRELVAELEVLERFDVLRHIAGHDYGSGQRANELRNRRNELALRSRRDDDATPPDVFELVAALDRLEGPRLARIGTEGYRANTPASRRTVQTWARLRAELESRKRNVEAELAYLARVEAADVDPFAAVVDSGYSPADDERDFEEEAWQRRDREAEALAELEGEFGDEVRAVVESRRIAESDPSQRHGFSRRVASLAAVALAALAVAMPATASSTSDDPCAKVYPPVETIAVGPRGFKRLVPAHPIMVAYVKCLRTVRPVGAPDRP